MITDIAHYRPSSHQRIAKLLAGGALAASVNCADAQQSPKAVECIAIADVTSNAYLMAVQ